MTKSLLIIAHTPSPNTRILAQAMTAVCASAELDLNCALVSPLGVHAPQVQQAAGVLLFTTENFGYMSGMLKDFFERIYYPCLEVTQGLPYCLCVRAGQDNGSGAATSVTRITTGLRWREVQPPLLCAGPFRPAFEQQAADYAEAFAQGLNLGIF